MALIKLNTRSIPDNAVTPAKVSQNLGRRNIVINGQFQVAQYATSVSSTDGTNEDYTTVDRWFFRYGNNAPGTMTISQSDDAPVGFAKSWKFDVTATGTSTGNHHTLFSQFIESEHLRNCGWDYTNPNSYLTLSFWIKSSKTGTYCVGMDANDVGGNFKFVKEYTINQANVWEKKIISVPGHASLVFNNDNTRGAEIGWQLASGGDRVNATDNTWHTADASRVTSNQVNFLDSTDNNLYITGVQLEVGSEATEFERMSFSEELAICKRYFQKSGNYDQYMTNGSSTTSFGVGAKAWAPCVEWGGSVAGHATHILSVEMRATPSIVKYGNSQGYWGYISSGGSAPTSDNTLAFHIHLYIGADGTGVLGVNNQATGSTIWGAMGGWTASAEI